MTIKTVEENLILTTNRVSRDGGALLLKCPHCKGLFGIDGDDVSEVQGEQYRHTKRELTFRNSPSRFDGCDGWVEVGRNARYVKEL